MDTLSFRTILHCLSCTIVEFSIQAVVEFGQSVASHFNTLDSLHYSGGTIRVPVKA